MKKLVLLILVFSNRAHSEGGLAKMFGISTESKEPAFLSNQPIDKPMSELNKKYRNAFYSVPCYDWVQKISKEKKIKWKCMELPLMSGSYRDDLFVVVQDGKVVFYGRGLAGNPNIVMFKSPTPEEEFGDEGPTLIYEAKSDYDTQSFNLLWRLNTGYVQAQITCALKKYAGKIGVGPLRKCAMHSMRFFRIRDFAAVEAETNKAKNLKLSSEKY